MPHADACEHTIVSIIPCEGWIAIFDDREDDYNIACWALIRCSVGGEYIAPIIAHDGDMVDATRIEGFVACEHDEGFGIIDLDDDGEGDDAGG